jgi:hypothetical protein
MLGAVVEKVTPIWAAVWFQVSAQVVAQDGARGSEEGREVGRWKCAHVDVLDARLEGYRRHWGADKKSDAVDRFSAEVPERPLAGRRPKPCGRAAVGVSKTRKRSTIPSHDKDRGLYGAE